MFPAPEVRNTRTPACTHRSHRDRGRGSHYPATIFMGRVGSLTTDARSAAAGGNKEDYEWGYILAPHPPM